MNKNVNKQSGHKIISISELFKNVVMISKLKKGNLSFS